MADGGSVLKFPAGKEDIPAKSRKAPPPPAMDNYGHDEALDLYQIATSVKRKAEELVKFVDDNRGLARQAGIEVVAVQVNSILEGEKFQRVIDALEDAVYRGIPTNLTREGAEKVHRLEKLVADADTIIISHMNGKKPAGDYSMGQQQPTMFLPAPVYSEAPRRTDSSDWMPAIIFGIAGLVGLIAILAITQSRRS